MCVCLVLGLDYDGAIDLWATAVTMFEMATGNALFRGSSGDEMLKLMIELKGKTPIHMIKNSVVREKYFTSDNNFAYFYTDEVTKEVSNFNDNITSLTLPLISFDR